MKNCKLFTVVLILFTGIQILNGAPNVAEADSAYLAGDYVLAANLYSEIAAEHGVSAQLLFNQGNAYFQEGDYGNAMLCYQKAKKLDPGNKRINNNLKYLESKVEDSNKAEQRGKKRKVEADTLNFFQTIHKKIAGDSSSNAWAGWAATCFLLFSGCATLYLFTTNVLLRKTGFFGGFILLGLSMIFLVCAYSAAAEAENHEYGVVMGFKTALHTQPTLSDKNKNEGILTRGTKVRVISEETDAEGNVTWVKVRLNSDYIGWIEASDIAMI